MEEKDRAFLNTRETGQSSWCASEDIDRYNFDGFQGLHQAVQMIDKRYCHHMSRPAHSHNNVEAQILCMKHAESAMLQSATIPPHTLCLSLTQVCERGG